jgi:small-conductance mechanosensitive channel
MEWIERWNQILNFQVVQIGGSAITVQHILLFVIALLITRYVARSTRRLLDDHVLSKVEPAPRYVIIRMVQYAVWVVGIFIALEFLGVDLTALTVVAGALGVQYAVWVVGIFIALEFLGIDLTALTVVAGALGVGIGFGLQSVVSNFVSGLVLLMEQPIRIRDRVTVENVEGNVADIHFRSTTIVTNDNISIIVPNSQFINQTVINWSHGDPRIRIHVPVGVAYGSDVELVTNTLQEVAAQTEGVLSQPAPEVRFNEFGDSSLNFELLVWSDNPPGHLQLRSRLNYAIDAAFRRNDIQIPFPQRDVHVKSGSVISTLRE